MAAVAAKHDKFKDLDVEVLAVSVDSIFVHKVWEERELVKMNESGVPYPMLSDQDGSIGKLYSVYDEESLVNNRGNFIIDPDGILQGIEILAEPVGRSVSDTIRKIRALQHVRENENEAIPCGWDPGDKTLKPGKDLVGNVWKEWKVDQA